MKYTAIVLVALVLAVSTVQASDVLTLTTADFEKINQYELALVKFYAPWCGHCKVLAPAWEEIATKFADNDKVAIVKVDCTENQATCGKYGVRGYPTIKLFVGGTTGAISDYNGDRNAGAIIGFIEKKSSPPVKTLESASDVSEFKSDDDDDSNVIAHVSSAEDLEKIRSAALRIDDLDWAVVSDAALQEGEENVIFIYADHLSKPLRYEEFPLDLETFKKFVLANAYAPVQAIGQESWERATSRKLPLVIGIDKFENEQLPADFKTILNEAAAKYKDRFSFLYGDSAKLEQAVSGMGGTGKVFPTLIVLSSDEESRATLPGPHTFVWNEKETITSSGVDAWLKAALDGTVQPFKKSQPIPENDGPVKTLVALNFDDAIKATEWVFIKFYAPWCGHCKTLAPIWEELGEEFKSDDRVTIAKMDVTENYLDTKYGVSSFPTLILLHNGEIHGEKYSEGRTLEDLSKFLRKTIAGDDTHSAEGHGHSHDHDEL